MSCYKINKNPLVCLQHIHQSNIHCISLYFVLSSSERCRGGSQVQSQVQRKQRQVKSQFPNSQVTSVRSGWVTSSKPAVRVHQKSKSIKILQLAWKVDVKHEQFPRSWVHIGFSHLQRLPMVTCFIYFSFFLQHNPPLHPYAQYIPNLRLNTLHLCPAIVLFRSCEAPPEVVHLSTFWWK